MKHQRPESVNLGLWCSKIRDYMEPPPRRFRCQRCGHIAKHCLSKVPRCSNCGGAHEWRKCPSGAAFKCANCEGSHAAYTAGCPAWLAAIRRAKTFVSGSNPAPVGSKGSSVNKFRKSAPPKTNVEYPTLTPLRKNGDHTYASVASSQNSPVRP